MTSCTVTAGLLVGTRRVYAIQAVTKHSSPQGSYRCYVRNRPSNQGNMAEQPMDYSKWSNENLIERVTQLERQLKEQTEKYLF